MTKAISPLVDLMATISILTSSRTLLSTNLKIHSSLSLLQLNQSPVLILLSRLSHHDALLDQGAITSSQSLLIHLRALETLRA